MQLNVIEEVADNSTNENLLEENFAFSNQMSIARNESEFFSG